MINKKLYNQLTNQICTNKILLVSLVSVAYVIYKKFTSYKSASNAGNHRGIDNDGKIEKVAGVDVAITENELKQKIKRLFELKGYKKVIELSSKGKNLDQTTKDIRYKALAHSNMYKQLFFDMIINGEKQNTDDMLKKAVEIEMKNYDTIYDVSNIFVNEVFEYFESLFSDFEDVPNEYEMQGISHEDSLLQQNKPYMKSSNPNKYKIQEANHKNHLLPQGEPYPLSVDNEQVLNTDRLANNRMLRKKDTTGDIKAKYKNLIPPDQNGLSIYSSVRNAKIENKQNSVNKGTQGNKHDGATAHNSDFLRLNLHLADKNKITRFIFEKIQTLVKSKNYAALKSYVSYKKDNLSILIKLIFAYLTNDNLIHEIVKSANNLYKTKYEMKIHTYIRSLYDYYNKKEVAYENEDATTIFLKYKLKTKNVQKYLVKLLNKGIFPFVYYELLKEDYSVVDDAYLLFPSNCQILSLLFETYVITEEYRKADAILKNLLKYHRNDPRTYVCMFLKELIKNNSTNKTLEILLESYKIDKKYYRTAFLLGQLYYQKNNSESRKWLNKAIIYCNNYEVRRKIVEMLILIELQDRQKHNA